MNISLDLSDVLKDIRMVNGLTDEARAKIDKLIEKIDKAGSDKSKIEKDLINLETKQQAHKLKVRQLWEYSSQIGSMILSQLSQTAKDTKSQARLQTALAVQNIISTQFSVTRAYTQASLAYASGNYIQGAMLTMIAMGMEFQLVAAMNQREQAKMTEEIARQQAEQIKMWSTSNS